MTTLAVIVGVLFVLLPLDLLCYLAAVRRARRVGTYWQGFCPGSGFYFLLRPERLKRADGSKTP